jgi:hypothetical protein
MLGYSLVAAIWLTSSAIQFTVFLTLHSKERRFTVLFYQAGEHLYSGPTSLYLYLFGDAQHDKNWCLAPLYLYLFGGYPTILGRKLMPGSLIFVFI